MKKSKAHFYGFCELKCVHWQKKKCQAPNKALGVRGDECVIIEEQRKMWQREMMGE